jgi:hypothetical protein
MTMNNIVKQCPVCRRPSAPNHRADDLRCGPCHNFGLLEFTKYGNLVIQSEFYEWLKKTAQELHEVNNMESYMDWLRDLHIVHNEKSNGN